MERVIAEARRNNQPAYIVVPSDYAQAPVTPAEVRPLTLKSNEASLKKAVAAIADRLAKAKSVVVLPAFTLSRVGLQKEAREAIEALGCPFATTSMEKCIIDESHRQFAGMYSGALSSKGTREIVEGAELVIDLGGVSFNDESTMGFSTQLNPARLISIGLNDVRVGEQIFGNVRLADTLAALAKLKSSAPATTERQKAIRR
jgi:indolepyruvate decarboxylase